ncbi:MAG: hypothetical protein IT558_01080 [Alphaproteobacteria bacterium]|nr:hypothetical protein [Alphaproteobacteria bacterium]
MAALLRRVFSGQAIQVGRLEVLAFFSPRQYGYETMALVHGELPRGLRQAAAKAKENAHLLLDEVQLHSTDYTNLAFFFDHHSVHENPQGVDWDKEAHALYEDARILKPSKTRPAQHPAIYA